MVWQAMGVRWTSHGIEYYCFMLLIFGLGIRGCFSLDSEGLALLEFRARVVYDPYGAFKNWNQEDHYPCGWLGVHCVDSKVHMLDLNGLSLEGVLAPELGKLTHLRSLVLSNNCFSGAIPNEFGQLTLLEVLDLRDNSLSGTIPAELGGLRSLKHLLLSNNKFEGSLPLELGRLNLLSDLQLYENFTSASASGVGCLNRKFGQCMLQSGLRSLMKVNSFLVAINYYFRRLKFGKASLHSHGHNWHGNLPAGLPEPHLAQNLLVSSARRRLVEEASNLVAAPSKGGSPPDQIIALPSSRSSGSFPAVPKGKKLSPPPAPPPANPPSQGTPRTPNLPAGLNTSGGKTSDNTVKYIAGASIAAFLLIVALVLFVAFRKQAAKTIRPWKSGISGQLQRAFVTGVPKLNWSELETACEDFSNIIQTFDGCTMYKGTLSSGVEIAVLSTVISSSKDWSKRSEIAYRKKIDTLSRVNHKNFVNLIGYCVEDEPFVRMMVFEYAPNGSLSEHLHVKELEHLDWSARMRIIMGTAYCLQYIHELNPPVAHSNVNSNAIMLTDDYAAKIAEIGFWSELSAKAKISGEGSEHSELPPPADHETNVYSFGILLLEIISGKLPHSEEQGNLVNWATDYLNDKRRISNLIDPTLKSFKKEELDIICEVIQECIQQESRRRPTMREITSMLRNVLDISPDAAVPRLSPLWWAELEILSAEAP